MRTFHCTALALALTGAPLLAADGDLDTTFGAGTGKFIWTSGGSVEVAAAAVSETTGAGFAVGTIELEGEEPALHWKGVNRDGADIDQGCAQASETLFTLATGGSGGTAALIDSSGNLLVGGWAAFSGSADVRRALVARFDLTGPGCDLDGSYSSNGWEIFDDLSDEPCDTDDCEIVDLVEITPATGAVLAPRVVALVRIPTSFATARFRLLGLTGAGAIDSGFGDGGWSEVDDPSPGIGMLTPFAQLAVDAIGRLYVHAARLDPDGTLDVDALALRFLPNGDLDTNFGAGGTYFHGDNGDDDAADTFPRGQTVLANGVSASVYQADADNAILATIDPALQLVLAQSVLIAADLTAQGNNRIVTVGEPANGDDGFTLERRIFAPGSQHPMDESFGSFGIRTHDLDLGGSNSETARSVGLWSGRIVVAGDAPDGSGRSGFLLRTQNAYVFADGFEQGTAALWSDLSGFDFPE